MAPGAAVCLGVHLLGSLPALLQHGAGRVRAPHMLRWQPFFLNTATSMQVPPREIANASPGPPPAGFFCPLTGILMRNPVILRDSAISYERAAIEWALHMNPAKCPVSGLMLNSEALDADVDLRDRIAQWAEVNEPELLVRSVYFLHASAFVFEAGAEHCGAGRCYRPAGGV